MEESSDGYAQKIALVALALHEVQTGHAPHSATVLMGRDALTITLHGALSPAERQLADDPAGAARIEEFHRQLFASSGETWRTEIRRITGVAVREATVEVQTKPGIVAQQLATGTIVQVFMLDGNVPTETWSGTASAQLPPLN